MRYDGIFTADGDQLNDEIRECIETGSIGGGGLLMLDAAGIVAERSFEDLHLIAQCIERTVHGEIARISAVLKRPPKEVTRLRIERGDTHLWLQAGAESSEVVRRCKDDLPANVARAEFLAVLAIWKGLLLNRAARASIMSLIRASSAPPKQVVEEDELVAHLTDGYANALGAGQRAALLGAEFARAATLATEAAYLASRLDEAKAKGREEAQLELREMQDHRIREAGAKGGKKRAEKFGKVKQRILHHYTTGGYTASRNSTAAAILDKLRDEGIEAKHEFVRDTLAAHDRARTKPKG